MYNDPTLNPAVYLKQPRGTGVLDARQTAPIDEANPYAYKEGLSGGNIKSSLPVMKLVTDSAHLKRPPPVYP